MLSFHHSAVLCDLLHHLLSKLITAREKTFGHITLKHLTLFHVADLALQLRPSTKVLNVPEYRSDLLYLRFIILKQMSQFVFCCFTLNVSHNTKLKVVYMESALRSDHSLLFMF